MARDDHSEDSALRADLHTDAGVLDDHDTGDVPPAVSRDPGRALRPKPARDDSGLQTPNSPQPDTGPLSDGGRRASGRGHANGDTLRDACSRGDLERPNFNVEVGPNGYAWWYVDGLSHDGTRAVSVIGFIGSVFSPWYRWSGRKHPQNHVCINVATYGRGGRFTMTDRGVSALRQTASRLQIGPSMMRWENGQLIIEIDEMSSPPLINRIRGQICVKPSAITGVELPLCPDDSHIWRPFAPSAEITVDIDRPGWTWSGHGYFDANFGTRALEEDFTYWTWGRFPTPGGAHCFYDAIRRDGSELAASFAFDRDGSVRHITPPPKASLPRSLWAVTRETRSDVGYAPRQVKHMLDAPFYSRSAVRTKLGGFETTGIHEALDLRRFRNPLLKPMLALRVPRRPKWKFETG